MDRYKSTVWQVDLLLDGDELWTHVKLSNPHPTPTLGYWWTCAAHTASPGTRILAPASLVTVETFVGSPLRNAPWPAFDNGMLNSTFSGVSGSSTGAGAGAGGMPTVASRLTDSSFLGNIAYTGDYFLRVPNASRKWIAHVDDSSAYVAVHVRPAPRPNGLGSVGASAVGLRRPRACGSAPSEGRWRACIACVHARATEGSVGP